MKAVSVLLIGLGIVLLLAGLVSALGVKLDVVKQCNPNGSAYTLTWTGFVGDKSGVGIPNAGVLMFDYGPDMTSPYQTAMTQTSGSYLHQFTVWPAAAGHRYELDARKSGYDTASAYVILSCVEDLPPKLQPPTGHPVLYANFTLSAVQPLVASFVYTKSGGTVDFFDRSSGGPDRWTWSFGDGSQQIVTNLAAVEHNYTSSGTYLVRMKADRTLTDPATSYAFANVTVSITGPPGGAPPPPPPPPPPGSCNPLTDPACPGGSQSSGSSDTPPADTTSSGTTEGSGSGKSQTTTRTVFEPGLATIVLLIAGFVLVLVGVALER